MFGRIVVCEEVVLTTNADRGPVAKSFLLRLVNLVFGDAGLEVLWVFLDPMWVFVGPDFSGWRGSLVEQC